MTAPTYSSMESAIRSAWAGKIADAFDVAGPGTDAAILENLELLAAAPFAYKPASADAVRGAWVRAGGVTPAVPRGSISDPAPRVRLPAL